MREINCRLCRDMITIHTREESFPCPRCTNNIDNNQLIEWLKERRDVDHNNNYIENWATWLIGLIERKHFSTSITWTVFCKWKKYQDNTYLSGCGKPKKIENFDFKFCPYCVKEIKLSDEKL